MRPIIPAVSSAIRFDASSPPLEILARGRLDVRDVHRLPGVGGGHQEDVRLLVLEVEDACERASGPGELRMGRRIVDLLAFEPQLAPPPRRPSRNCSPVRAPVVASAMGYSYPNATRGSGRPCHRWRERHRRGDRAPVRGRGSRLSSSRAGDRSRSSSSPGTSARSPCRATRPAPRTSAGRSRSRSSGTAGSTSSLRTRAVRALRRPARPAMRPGAPRSSRT